MRKLSLSILAAGTVLLATAASAQNRPGPPRHGPGPGHTWRGGPAHGPNVQVRHRGGPNVQVRHRGPNVQFRQHGGNRFVHPGRNFRHRRHHRGGIIHPFWFGGQFHINNWQVYGFADPGQDQRWIRYYDDAYLIDRGGRVVDTRYGMDWDRYGEEWEMDEGIPAYRGRRHGGGDDEEYSWSEEQESDEGYGYEMRGGGGPMPMPPGYGYGGGYYGYGMYAYPIVIETITTGGGYTEEIIEEEYVEVRRRPRVRARCHCPRPVVRRPAPPRRPPPGERG